MKARYGFLIVLVVGLGLVSCVDLESALAEALGNGSGSFYIDNYSSNNNASYNASNDASQVSYGYASNYGMAVPPPPPPRKPAWRPRPGAHMNHPPHVPRGHAPSPAARPRHDEPRGARHSERHEQRKDSPRLKGGGNDRPHGSAAPSGHSDRRPDAPARPGKDDDKRPKRD